jgi:DNA-binding NarL/FixJ family response regulator
MQSNGAVLLAEGDGRGALDALRAALSLWDEIGALYESARTRALVGVACRMLSDMESAELELDGARRTLVALGARPDAIRVADLITQSATRRDRLTVREVEVLRLVASGLTNKAIAKSLKLSEKTVARHVANIFEKLDLSSRAAATAYAYDHGLVTPRT